MHVSDVIDMSNPANHIEVVRLMLAAKARMIKLAESFVQLNPDRQNRRPTRIELNDIGTTYHCKEMSAAVLDRGLALVPYPMVTKGTRELRRVVHLGHQLAHYCRVLNRLWKFSRQYVAFPIAVVAANANESDARVKENCFLVFEDLRSAGYRQGLPPLDKMYEFLRVLCDAVESFEKAGVIHCDLYVSNMFWKVDVDGVMNLKVIDWDWSHLIGERPTDDCLEHISAHKSWLNSRLKHVLGDVICPELDVTYVELIRFANDHWEQMGLQWETFGSDQAGVLNDAFNGVLGWFEDETDRWKPIVAILARRASQRKYSSVLDALTSFGISDVKP